MSFIKDNAGMIVTALILLGAVALVVYRLVVGN